MNKAIFITVRNGSSRLPNKAWLEINGISSIEYLINRVKFSQLADKIVLCTTENSTDDNLVDLAKKNNIDYFRGSEEDKLERWFFAAKKHKVDFFVTADGDDTFCEPQLIDIAFHQYNDYKTDFIHGDRLITGSFTYGISFSALAKVIEIKDTTDTEMMWVYFTQTGLFDVHPLKPVTSEYYRDDIRMTLDYPEDLEFFRTVDGIGGGHFPYLDLDKIIEIIDRNPFIKDINYFRHIQWAENQRKNTKLILKAKNEKSI